MKFLQRTLIAVACLLAPASAMSATVVASIYFPGDGTVPKNDYNTSSGERYDAKAMKCASPDLPLGTKLYLRHGRSAAEVTINDRGPWVAGRGLDCTPAVDKALHLDGLDRVKVDSWPPLPKPRPENTK